MITTDTLLNLKENSLHIAIYSPHNIYLRKITSVNKDLTSITINFESITIGTTDKRKGAYIYDLNKDKHTCSASQLIPMDNFITSIKEIKKLYPEALL